MTHFFSQIEDNSRALLNGGPISFTLKDTEGHLLTDTQGALMVHLKYFFAWAVAIFASLHLCLYIYQLEFVTIELIDCNPWNHQDHLGKNVVFFNFESVHFYLDLVQKPNRKNKQTHKGEQGLLLLAKHFCTVSPSPPISDPPHH